MERNKVDKKKKKGIVMTVNGRDGQVDGYDEDGDRWENV